MKTTKNDFVYISQRQGYSTFVDPDRHNNGQSVHKAVGRTTHLTMRTERTGRYSWITYNCQVGHGKNSFGLSLNLADII